MELLFLFNSHALRVGTADSFTHCYRIENSLTNSLRIGETLQFKMRTCMFSPHRKAKWTQQRLRPRWLQRGDKTSIEDSLLRERISFWMIHNMPSRCNWTVRLAEGLTTDLTSTTKCKWTMKCLDCSWRMTNRFNILKTECWRKAFSTLLIYLITNWTLLYRLHRFVIFTVRIWGEYQTI